MNRHNKCCMNITFIANQVPSHKSTDEVQEMWLRAPRIFVFLCPCWDRTLKIWSRTPDCNIRASSWVEMGFFSFLTLLLLRLPSRFQRADYQWGLWGFEVEITQMWGRNVNLLSVCPTTAKTVAHFHLNHISQKCSQGPIGQHLTETTLQALRLNERLRWTALVTPIAGTNVGTFLQIFTFLCAATNKFFHHRFYD